MGTGVDQTSNIPLPSKDSEFEGFWAQRPYHRKLSGYSDAKNIGVVEGTRGSQVVEGLVGFRQSRYFGVWGEGEGYTCGPKHLPFQGTLSLYIYIYTYIYIYLSIYDIYIYIYTHIHPSIHPSMHACMHACIHTYIHTCIHTYIYIPE